MGQRTAASRRIPGHRRLRGRATLAAAAALLAALSAFSALGHGEGLDGDRAGVRVADAASIASAPGRSVAVAVIFDASHRGRRVAPGFLGLSFEVSSLAQIAQYGGGGNFVKLLRSLGPGVLRFGGASADTRVAWSDSSLPRAPWASRLLTGADLRRLARVASASGWRVLLTLGLAHFEPAAAAREASAARAALGRLLAGVELGNEPDAYMHHGLREAPWTFAQYGPQARSYLRAIAALTPAIPLAGPDVSGSAAFFDWGTGEAAHLRPTLLTGHHYPLGCHDVPTPSIERLLSAETRAAEDASLVRYMRVARSAGLAFRLDETNTVSCGGKAGVSDTFASALWAVSYIARSMAAGVAGINFHDDPANCRGYAPLCATSAARLGTGTLSVRPEWYALLLAKALIGDRPIASRVASLAPPGHEPNLSVSALRAPGERLHVVVVDDDPPGSPRVMLHLHVPRGYGVARVLALTAPSPSARAGVRLSGRSVQADGGWSEPRNLPRVLRRGKLIAIAIAPSSAMLITLS
jgi:hypothetical protein